VRSLAARSVDGPEAAARWREARSSIRECPWYAGLALAPQLGLLPIGQDPDSGLWEFAHLETGEPPVRDADGTLVRTEAMGLVFVLVPGGTFLMGAQSADPSRPNYDPQAYGDEGPVRSVQLSPFFLSKYEMTQAQWERITGTNPSYWKPKGLRPVEQVSWEECDTLCARLGLALPSEAQWEYAARAGTSTPWWSGDDPSVLVEVANLADRSYRYQGGARDRMIEDWDDGVYETAVIGSFAANPFGFHDVIGNVWEWCRDWYTSAEWSGGTVVDPVREERGVATERVDRGGGFGNAALFARVSLRSSDTPEVAALGLRPARKIE
jgi:formylglycine-generating enzyme required for sulfatase activity